MSRVFFEKIVTGEFFKICHGHLGRSSRFNQGEKRYHGNLTPPYVKSDPQTNVDFDCFLSFGDDNTAMAFEVTKGGLSF